MSRQFVATVFSLLTIVLGTSLPARANELGPETFVSGIVSKEIDGDTLARRDKVIFSDGKQVEGGCDCSVPRDTWPLDQDSFNIVSSWNVIGSKPISHGKYEIAVHFHIIARAMNNYHPGWAFGDFRQILVPPKTTDEVVSYVLVARGKTWEILDPPEPRVSARAVWGELNRQIELETDLRRQGEDEHDEKAVAYRNAAINGYMTELNTLRYAVLAASLPEIR